MMHFADGHMPQWLSPAVVVVGLWSGSALAVTVYDIGRWLCAW